ncbi:MAG: hypothetical protein ACKVX7_06750 [Planctomycetota bacterium]
MFHRALWAPTLVVGLAIGLASEVTAQDRLPEVEQPNVVKPGTKALLKAKLGMRYFLRVPASYDAKRGARMVVFLHGSNMNGMNYLGSFEQMGWAKDDLLVCPNGETGDAPYGANNFTFDSARYVAEITRDVKAAFNVTRIYVGGHSQGGFLTYSVITLFPDLYHGAIPMAGNCWSQNEPNLWEERPDLLAKQRKIAIAVIHGQRDPVVPFEDGKHGYDVFRAMGYPRLRLFAPKNLGHEFMLAPVDEALDWLDSQVGNDAQKCAALGEKWAGLGEWGWAIESARTALELGAKGGAKQTAQGIIKAAEAAAKKQVAAMAKLMATKPGEAWVPKWLEFWRLHGPTQTAAELVKHYEKLRGEQRVEGRRLFGQARDLYQSDRAKAEATLADLLVKAPATFEAYYALAWLKKLGDDPLAKSKVLAGVRISPP